MVKFRGVYPFVYKIHSCLDITGGFLVLNFFVDLYIVRILQETPNLM